MAAVKQNSEIMKNLNGMDRAYETGNKTWFNFLADDITVYGTTSAEPINGRKNYIENFSKTLTGAKRKVNILSRQVQSVGNVVIVYQVAQITQDGIVLNMKQSQVWSTTEKGLKMNHMHSALLGTPQSVTSVSKLGSINVINERIAAIATAVGVAQ
jgi:SnoaL-like domain